MSLFGELAQSGRAPALQAGSQEFESPILHSKYLKSKSYVQGSKSRICDGGYIRHRCWVNNVRK
jgi:hypothetical protein